jgi:tRNA dimethylallyltransferase
VALVHPRPTLEKRLTDRLSRMLERGWLGEVEDLASRFDFALPAFGAVGYRQLYAVVRQHVVISDARTEILLRTRQYAKRQVTWFRHQGAFSEVPAQSGVTAKITLGFRRFAENKSA